MHMFFLLGATLVFMTCALALHSSNKLIWGQRVKGICGFLGVLGFFSSCIG